MYVINCIFSFLSIIIIIKMKNKVNKKRGVKFLRGRAREGRGKSPYLLEATARPRSGQKRAGKKEGGLGEGIFARLPVLGGGWVCGCRRQPHKSEFGVGILFKVGSNFFKYTPYQILLS